MANVEVPPHPGTIIFHPRIRNPSIHVQLQQPGDKKKQIPRVDNASRGVETPTPLAACELAEAHGASAGRQLPLWTMLRTRRIGEDKVSSPDQKSFRTSTTAITRRRKRTFPGSIPPCRVWKPQPHWVIADWLGLMKPARSENSPSGQRRSPAAPGKDFPSPEQKSFHVSTTPSNRGRLRISPRSIPLRTV